MPDTRAERRLDEAMLMSEARGYVYGHCSVCDGEHQIEPGAHDVDCEDGGCDGKVSSPLVLEGMI